MRLSLEDLMKTGQRFALWGACVIAFCILAAESRSNILQIASHFCIAIYLVAALILLDIRRTIKKGNIAGKEVLDRDLSLLEKQYATYRLVLVGYEHNTGETTPTFTIFSQLNEEFARLNTVVHAWDAYDIVRTSHYELCFRKLHLDRAIQFYAKTDLSGLKLRYSVLREEAERQITMDFNEHLSDIENDYRSACMLLHVEEDRILGTFLLVTVIERLEGLTSALPKPTEN